MKLLGSTNNKITKDENGKNTHHLERAEIVLLHFNIVINDHQHASSALCTFILNKSFWSIVRYFT